MTNNKGILILLVLILFFSIYFVNLTIKYYKSKWRESIKEGTLIKLPDGYITSVTKVCNNGKLKVLNEQNLIRYYYPHEIEKP